MIHYIMLFLKKSTPISWKQGYFATCIVLATRYFLATVLKKQNVMCYFKILIFLHYRKYLGFMCYVVGSLWLVSNKISLLLSEQELCLLQLSLWNIFLILDAYNLLHSLKPSW